MPVVGTSQVRKDAEAKARGRARYVDDLVVPGMLHGCAVRCPSARRSIERVDPSAALARPGVHAVLVAAHIPGRNVVPLIFEDMPFLAEREARYHGEAVALVVADTDELARAAARDVVVEGQELPATTDFETAEDPSTPLVNSLGGSHNLIKRYAVRRGDVDAAIEGAAAVVTGEYRTGYQEHAYLEPQGMLAIPEPDGGMTIHGSMQCPFYVQKAVAVALAIPLHKVRVVVAVTGGGFGGKEDVPSLVAAHAALLAAHTGRPVKFILERGEDIIAMSKRHPSVIRMTHAADAEGRLLAVRAEYVVDAGAYSGISTVVLWRGTVHAAGPYVVPNVDIEGRAVATNRSSCGAFRGFGQPQVSFASESQMDRLAEELGIDPVEIRLRNALTEGAETATSHRLGGSVGLREALTRARERSDWFERRGAAAEGPGPDGMLRGVGVSCLYYGVGLGAGGAYLARAGAQVQVCLDGSVEVSVGTTDMGQGSETVLCQIAADALGVGYERVRMMPVDTSRVPDSGPTVASRSTILSGNAILDAAGKIRVRIHRVAAEALGVGLADLTWEDGVIAVRSDPSRKVTFVEAVGKCAKLRVPLTEQGFWAVPGTFFDEGTGVGDAYMVYTFVANVAEVAVDPATFQVRVERVTSVYDVKPVNPTLIEGQAQGGIVQGIGYALHENLIVRDGVVETADLATYVIPGTCETPEFVVDFTPAAYGNGPFGVKGMGETPILAIAPAITNALTHALGTRPMSIPVLPEHLMELAKRE